MNTVYSYKTSKNTTIYNDINSKKGTYRAPIHQDTVYTDFAEKSLSFIDMILDFLCSARTLVGAKAIFGFIALIGLIGVIGGIEFGTISLVSGVLILSAIIGLEFFILRD